MSGIVTDKTAFYGENHACNERARQSKGEEKGAALYDAGEKIPGTNLNRGNVAV